MLSVSLGFAALIHPVLRCAFAEQNAMQLQVGTNTKLLTHVIQQVPLFTCDGEGAWRRCVVMRLTHVSDGVGALPFEHSRPMSDRLDNMIGYMYRNEAPGALPSYGSSRSVSLSSHRCVMSLREICTWSPPNLSLLSNSRTKTPSVLS